MLTNTYRTRRIVLTDSLLVVLIVGPVLLAVFLTHLHNSSTTLTAKIATTTQASTYALKPGTTLKNVLNNCLSEAAAAHGMAQVRLLGSTSTSSIDQRYSAQRASCYQRFNE